MCNKVNFGLLLIAGILLSGASQHMHSHVQYGLLTEEDMERFHGHLGPFVVLGAKMGDHAVTAKDVPKYFDLKVEVTCPAKPPHSCLIDGVQLGSGATMGKKNLVHVVGDSISVKFTKDETGESVTYRIKDHVTELLQTWAKEELEVEERGHRIFAMQAEELFDIE